MKKMFALMTIVLFLVAAVPLLAAEDSGETSSEDTAAPTEDATTSTTPRERVRTLVQDKVGTARERAQEIKGTVKELAQERKGTIKERVIERKELARERLENVREKVHTRVREKIAGHRLDRVGRLQEKHPKAAEFIAGLTEEKQKIFLHLGRAKQKELLELDDADAELGKFRLKKVNKGLLFKNRAINTVKRLKGEEDFKGAKERYNAAKNGLKEARKAFDDAKKAGDPEATMEAAKEYLLLAVDIEIAALEKIKGKVEASEELTEDEAAEILADIEVKITKLEDARAAVEAATTKEEVQEAARTILGIARKIKVRFARHVTRIKFQQVGAVVGRSSHLEERFDCAVATLEEQDVDTTLIQDLMDEFSAKVEAAKNKHSQANVLLKEAKELRETDDTGEGQVSGKVQESRKLLQEAQSDLKNAHTILKDILREVKASGGKLGACAAKDADLAADEEVIVEEVDDDDYDDIEVPVEEGEEESSSTEINETVTDGETNGSSSGVVV